MDGVILTALESLMLVTALSMDAFVASFAYGTNRVKIPFSSVTVINVICSTILGISLFCGVWVSKFIPESVTHVICFGILFVLGLAKLAESGIEFLKSRKKYFKKTFLLSFIGLKIKTSIYPDKDEEYTLANKVLTPIQAAPLSIALSLDGLAVGFGAALYSVNSIQVVAFSLISDMVAVMLGAFIGHRVAQKVSFNLTWLSGVLLMMLAFLKL